jgi:hypothetical protein
MKHVSRICLPALLAIACMGAAHADECFKASGALGDDAQTIRQTAGGIGWTVGVPASLAAASVVKGKVALYPKGTVQVCLDGDRAGELSIKVQASSADAGAAEWHKVPAKRKG